MAVTEGTAAVPPRASPYCGTLLTLTRSMGAAVQGVVYRRDDLVDRDVSAVIGIASGAG